MKPIAVATKFALYGTVGLGLAAGALVYGGSVEAGSSGDRSPVRVQRVTDPAEITAAGFPEWSQNVYKNSLGKYSRLSTSAEITAETETRAQLREAGEGATIQSLFGNTDTSTYSVPGTAFQPVSNTTLISRGFVGDFSCPNTEGADEYFAPVNLPSGVLVTSIRAFGSDTSVNDDPNYYLTQTCYISGSNSFSTTTIASADIPNGYVGGAFSTTSGAVSHTVDNADCAYHIQADTSEGICDVGDHTTYFVEVKYRRQISPAPGTATFLDVPVGGLFHAEVEAMADAGITGGCGGGNFCPGATVTRGQMAAFLSRALGLHWDEN